MIISCRMLTGWVIKYSRRPNAPVLSAKKGGGMAGVVAPVAVVSKRGTLWLEPLPEAIVPLDVQSPDYDECKCRLCRVPKAIMLTKLSSKLNSSAVVILLAPQASVSSRMSRGTPSSSGPG